MDIEKRVGVGVGLVLMKEVRGEVLLGLRRGIEDGGSCSHGGGTWGFPGGKLEYGEKARDRAVIEVFEETGLTADRIKLIDEFPWKITEDFHLGGQYLHNITAFFRASYLSGEPRVIEPGHCKEWKWYSWKRLPGNLFLPVENLVKQGVNPFGN